MRSVQIQRDRPAYGLVLKTAAGERCAGTLWHLRTFQPARGGEVSEALPEAPPRTASKPLRGLAGRVAPIAGIVAVFAIQAAVGAGPVLAFPLYLTVILLTALQLSRTESLATALLSAIAILLPTVFGGQRLDMATAGLLAIVLVVAAVAITEVVHQIRSTAAQAQRHAGEVAANEERQRLMLEAALVGLAVVDAEGRWVQVNERLGTILGRLSDELLQLPIEEVTAEN